MAENDVQIKVGMVPDTASNNRTIEEILKGKKAVNDFQKSVNEASRADVSGIARGFDKTTANIKKANDELDAFRKDLVKAAEEANEIQPGGKGGGGAPAAAKFRGAAGLIGGDAASNVVGVIDDIQDGIEGIQQLGSAVTGLVPSLAGGAAGMAAFAVPLIAIGAVVAGVALAVKGAVNEIQAQLAQLSNELDAERSAVEAAFGGATVSEAKAQIDQYNNSIAAQTELLERNQGRTNDAFEELVNSKEQVFGFLGDFAARLQVFFGLSKVGEFQQEVDKSKESLGKATAGAKEWQEELDAGSFKADEAAKAEAELSAARSEGTKTADTAAREKEASDRKAEQAAQKAQAEAEARAKEAAQLQQQQVDMQIKNADAIKKINQGALDNITDIMRKAGDAQMDGRNKFITDLNNLSIKANDEELNAQIKANRAEQAAIKEHRKRIQDIIDRAADNEENAREQRNFIAFVQAQKDAQKELNKQPAEFETGRQERELAAQQEREDRLRALELARRDLKQGYDQEEVMRRTGIERALRDNQIAKNRQLRDQATGFQQEAELFNRHLQNRLNLQQQFNQAEFQMLQANLNAVTGGGNRPTPAAPSSVFNNSSQIANTQISMTTIGMGGTLQMMRAAGYGR